ncbi:glycoside hydrolase family 88 protein [Thalassospira lucentensis]|uniref:glycoside hydrolase family 88 protein n=1 Tax=Thalassospira lucentensis TaxID=168935 RepID=UPI003AA8B4DF
MVKAQISSLIDYQAQNGTWHTLVDNLTSYEEISATSAIGYALLKGHRLGLGPESWKTADQKALHALLSNIDSNGVVQQVSNGTRMGHDLEFYKNIPLHPTGYGQSMALLCLVEALNHINE